ncbi:prolyl oligopeptidase family serine peptidase [Marinoscillum pacificum]|uniref:prolyl oligopeptidase family serine peptidase n=1 Tax=Marinoscillum pacificum TaxID=392723 RepID=UPI0021586427|nr:prolyl oligopeptidase family serine peptidase [Marinoscillum pacificum]
MKNTLPAIFLFILIINTTQAISQELSYPPTIEREVLNTYHGVNVYDNYQWLENIYSPEVRVWVESQNHVAEKYLKKLSNKHNSVNEMNKYMARDRSRANIGKFNIDRERESNFKLFYTDYFSGPSIFFRSKSYNDFKMLVDSRYLFKKSENKQAEIISFEPSQNDEILAYQYAVNGKPWGEIRLKNTSGIQSPNETLYQTQFNQINWYKNGFFYQKSKIDSATNAKSSPAIYYHRINTSQKEDSLVFKTNNIDDEIRLFSTIKEDIFLLEIKNKVNDQYSYLFWKPNSEYSGYKPIVYKVNYSFGFVDYLENRLILKAVISDQIKLISIDPNNPKDLKIISKSFKDAVITGTETLGNNHIAISYQSLSMPLLIVVDPSGNLIGEVALPQGVSISRLSYQRGSDKLYFLLKSFTIPPVLCELNMNDFTYSVIEKTGVNFDFKSYKFTESSFTSKDGTTIPIFIVYKNELKQDGSTPMLLEAYGGFGAINTSNYDPNVIYFIENGGAYAYAYTRGGGELGHDWWYAGKKLNKQNAIDDYISAGEFLIKEGYTKPKKLGIVGYSHGGLLAASAMIQKPELFGAVMLNDGLSDMLRYENNILGSSIVNEFGSVTNEEEFYNLADYSPYHRLDPRVNYPPVLFTATFFDHRISPMHSYKFAASLQNNPSQQNPVILFTNSDVGSYGSQSMVERLEFEAMKVSFLDEFLLND